MNHNNPERDSARHRQEEHQQHVEGQIGIQQHHQQQQQQQQQVQQQGQQEQQQEPPQLHGVPQIGFEYLHDRLNMADPAMMATPQERAWILEMKHAVEEWNRFEAAVPTTTDENDHNTNSNNNQALHHQGSSSSSSSSWSSKVVLGDMEYAQHVIVAGGNIPEALVRLDGIQRFRTEYNITHAREQALWYLKHFMDQQPGYILHMDVSPVTHKAILVTDSAAFFSDKALESDESWRICVGGVYYMHYTLWPTLATIRQGLFATVECDSVGWHNISMEYTTRLFEELFSYMPVLHKTIRAYNTTVVANLLFSLARPFMSRDMKRSVQLGWQVVAAVPAPTSSSSSTTFVPDKRRLSEFYLQPSLEASQQRILQRADALLAVRKYNEQTFRVS